MSPYNLATMNHREILSLWPSQKTLADELGEKLDTVKKWRTRGRIPDVYWTELLASAKKNRLKVTLEDLATARSKAA